MISYRTICCWSVVFALIYPAKRVIPASIKYYKNFIFIHVRMSVCNFFYSRDLGAQLRRIFDDEL